MDSSQLRWRTQWKCFGGWIDLSGSQERCPVILSNFKCKQRGVPSAHNHRGCDLPSVEHVTTHEFGTWDTWAIRFYHSKLILFYIINTSTLIGTSNLESSLYIATYNCILVSEVPHLLQFTIMEGTISLPKGIHTWSCSSEFKNLEAAKTPLGS